MPRIPGPLARRAAAAAATAIATGALTAGCSGGDPVPDAAPGPSTSSAAVDGPSVRADLDGDGTAEQVRLVDGRLGATLSSSGSTVSLRVGRSAFLSGVAELDSGRQVVAAGHSAVGLSRGGGLRPVTLGWFQPALVWADSSGRLLTGITHQARQTTYVAAYRWPRTGTDARPVPVEMHCLTGRDPVPRRCGHDTFLGSTRGLPVLRPQRDAPLLRVGHDAYAAPLPAGGTVDVRLTRSAAGGRDRAVVLVVGGTRLVLDRDGEGTAYLMRTALAHDGDLVLVTLSAIGDGATYQVVRYDGATLERVPVDGPRGWSLVSGGPAGGGPAIDTWLNAEGHLFTARSEAGVVFYEQYVAWTWECDRLVGRLRPGPLCLDSLGGTDAYGGCAFR